MSNNTPEQYSLEQYKLDLKRHDWFYQRSDDHSWFTKGRNEEDRLTRLAFANDWQEHFLEASLVRGI